MSVETIIQEALASNPLGVKAAFAEELSRRVAAALEEQKATLFATEAASDDDEDEDDDDEDEDDCGCDDEDDE